MCLTKNVRIFCSYSVSTILIGVCIYSIVNSHLNCIMEINSIKNDLQELLVPSRFFSADSSSKDNIELERNDQFKKSTEILWKEIFETRVLIDSLKSQSDIVNTEHREMDFALESLGGNIADTKCEPYIETSFFLSLLGLKNIHNEPRVVLTPENIPGNCFAFKGKNCSIIIKLMADIFIDSVGVEHLNGINPFTSAPKDFSIYGKNNLNDENSFYFGEFSYGAFINKPLQIFKLNSKVSESYRFIVFEFTSNHGNPNFTCIYRLSVFGMPKNRPI